MTTRALLRPLVLAVALVLITGPSASANFAPPRLPLDHFKCYQMEAPPPQPVKLFLNDQFDDRRGIVEEVTPGGPVWFCNPTTKEHQGGFTQIQHRDHHLTFYRFSPATGWNWTVLVRNQFFGGQPRVMQIGQPVQLAVPTAKLLVPTTNVIADPPRDLDHFKCYQVRQGPSPNVTVFLRDQFDEALKTTEQVRVGQPHLFCNPVHKRVVTQQGQVLDYPILHPDVHYVCYAIDPPGQGLPIVFNNQLQNGNATPNPALRLCVPTLKLVFFRDPFDGHGNGTADHWRQVVDQFGWWFRGIRGTFGWPR